LSSIWKDSLILPPLFAAISLLIIVVHYISARKFVKTVWARFTKDPIQEEESSEPNVVTDPNGFFAELRHHVESLGGVDIFTYRVLRLLSVFTLVGLSAATFVLDEAPSPHTTTRGKHWGKKHRQHRGGDTLTCLEWLDLAVSITYVSSQRKITPSAC
jgi:hypothetical protein